ncbi:nucleotidyltransferase domain-containing protein [Thermosynechococcus sichuanensis E542]|uniref:nucleotidyltransferase domain-containing protein n=1 Tax=Thermosynechococcus sichuanensis TaxID=3161974 RepID=UPI0015E54CAA|nr:nucleotidyltransferase domain-containing protein [Thermosynechococcus vestitus]AXY68116.2 nucleotidyltransferase domain-containing protein [Thermosynechococcus vestitus E542]
MTAANEDLRELKKILEDFFTGLPVKVYLFGSAARGTLRQSSDLDVGILPLAPLPVGLLSELREHLEMSKFDLSSRCCGFIRSVRRLAIASDCRGN